MLKRQKEQGMSNIEGDETEVADFTVDSPTSIFDNFMKKDDSEPVTGRGPRK